MVLISFELTDAVLQINSRFLEAENHSGVDRVGESLRSIYGAMGG